MNFDYDDLDTLIYWIKERCNIYKRRLQGLPKPWTEDPILQSNFFTMPYRELDKTTLWFKENFREIYYDDPCVILGTIIFRWFNYIPTGELLVNYGADQDGMCDLLTQWNPKLAKDLLRKRDKVFTGAFNISNSGSTKSKIDRVIDDYIGPMWNDRDKIVDKFTWSEGMLTLQDAHRVLSKYLGMGGSGFMAYEVVCDLRYTKFLESAPDVDSWCSMGPGASRGLLRLLNRLPRETTGWKPKPPIGWLKMMRELLDIVNTRLDTSPKNAYEMSDFLRSKKLPKFEMRELEHSLCEFDKYMRVKLGNGRSKRTYNGR